MTQVTHRPIAGGSLGPVIFRSTRQTGRALALATAAITAIFVLIPGAAPASRAPMLAVEPSSTAFHQGRTISLGGSARSADAGGVAPGTVAPGTIPGTIRSDLRIAAAVPDSLLLPWLKAKVPVQTEKLLLLIPPATAASSTLPVLRANVIRIAKDFLNAPTLEDRRSANRSKTICALGSRQSCSERWAWCAIFASSVWRMAGVRALSLTPPVGGIVQWGIAHRRWHDVTTRAGKRFLPSAGDIVAYGCNRKRTFCDHTGLVVTASRKAIRTIEGNTSTRFHRDGVGAKYRSRDSWVTGFVTLG